MNDFMVKWIHEHVVLVCVGNCTVQKDDLVPAGETAYTDTNPDVKAGDELTQMEILRIGKCREW